MKNKNVGSLSPCGCGLLISVQCISGSSITIVIVCLQSVMLLFFWECLALNNNEYLERLTRTGPKRLHVLYRHILLHTTWMNTHRLAHARTHTHAHTHTHTHTHTRTHARTHAHSYPRCLIIIMIPWHAVNTVTAQETKGISGTHYGLGKKKGTV